MIPVEPQTKRFAHWVLWLPEYRRRRVHALMWRLHFKGVLG